MKKTILSFAFCCFLATQFSCQTRQVQRVNPNEQIDLSGRWNDTDSKLVANEMIESVTKGNWRGEFEAKFNRKPVIIIGSIKNTTSEHIDYTAFVKNMEMAFINAGTVRIVQSGDERNQLRDERNDQQQFASEDTRKKWGREKGADFMMNGVITSIVDQYKNQKVTLYQVNFELTDLETNEKVWMGQKEIKKYIQN